MEEKRSIFEKFRLVERIDKEQHLENIEEKDLDIDAEKNPETKIANEENINKDNISAVNSLNKGTKKNANILLSIDEIYSKFKLENKKVNTIFLVDSYIKALPENLPMDIKKQSVLNIISASDMEAGKLINDGQDRLKALDTFMIDVSEETKIIINEYEKQIQELMNMIEEYKNIINDRKRFQEEQKACVDYELQKVQNIVDFIK